MSEDGKTTTDEKSSPSSKMESMSHEDLLKVVRTQLLLRKKHEAKISELTASNVSLCQTEEQIRNELDDEQTKSKNLIRELDQFRMNESKLQQELATIRESSECLQQQNETFKSLCQTLQSEITNLQSSKANVEHDLTNKFNEAENTIKKLQLEIDDLRSKSNTFDKDKQLMQEEINSYRQQIEDFHSQRIEFEKLQQQSSIHQSNENIDEIISQRIQSLLHRNDEQEHHISNELTDIPTLLRSIGITDHSNKDFSNLLNLENLLRLCSLLVERCKQLQTNETLLKSSIDKERISIIQNDDYEQCRLLIHRQDHAGLDSFFEHLFSWMNQSTESNDWQITLSKPINQDANQNIRLELNDLKFVPEQIEHELSQVRTQLDQLSKENEEQQREIATLRENLRSSEQSKEQLVEEREKTNELQNIINQGAIGKTKFDEFESSYQELQQKYHVLEEIKSEYDSLKEQLAAEREKTNELQNIINRETIDKTKFTELESLYQELQEKYHIAEQIKTEYDLFKENVNTTDVQLKQQLAEERERVNELQSIINQGTTDKTQLDKLQEKYHLLEQIKSEYDLLKENFDKINLQLQQEREKVHELQNITDHETIDKTKFVELESAYQELQEKYRLAEQIKSEYDLFKENVNTTDVELKQQLAEEREKTNELQNIINQGITDKTKFAELESSYQELQQKYHVLEEMKSEHESLKEQFAAEHERANNLQNIIDQETIDKTKFTELESLYQDLQEKYRLAEQIKSEYDMLKQNFDTTDLQLKQQLAEERERVNELQNIIDEKMIDKTKFTELESSYQELEQIKSEYESLKEQLTEERERVNELQNTIDQETIDKTKFNELESSYQQLQEKYQLLEQIKFEYDSLKEQLAAEHEKTNELQNIIDRETIDKTKFTELESSYQELQEKYHLAEQIKSEYELFKENVNTTDVQLKQQLSEERQKIIELQNTINEKMIDKTKFAELESSYQELEQKYQLLEEIKSKYNSLKENFDTTNLQLNQQQEINEQLKADNNRQHLYLVERDENIHLLKLDIEQQKQSLSKQQQQLSDILETTRTENKKLKEINLQLENDLKENNQLFFDKSKQADDLDRQLQILNNEYKDFKIKFDQLQKNLEKEKSESIKVIDNLKQELEKNKLQFDQIMKKNKEQIENGNQLQQTIENLKQELESAKDLQLKVNLANDLQQENEKLNQTISELNQKLENQTTESIATIQDLKDKNQKLKVLLTRLKKELQEKPKQTLMDLELADYEKTIKTLKEDLINKDKEIQDFHDEIKNLNEKILSLKQEIEHSEQQKLQTEERANKFQTLFETAKKELQDAKDLELQRHHNDDNVRTLIDKLQIDLDNNKVIVSQLLSEKQQLTERLNNQSETTQRTINLLEQNLRIAKHDLDVAKQDYDTLQDDFNNYKIRAQSVLKQHQSVQREPMPLMVDKQNELEETIEKLKTTLKEANNKIQLLISENEASQKEQDRLAEVQAKIVNEARKREQELRKQHQIELANLENECLKRTNDSHDMMKNVTIQNETLSTTFKEQISSIEADHERSITMLQNQLQAAKQEIEQLKNRIETLRQANIDNEKESPPIVVNNDLNKDELPWTFAERQQGEGSESASTDYQSTDVATKTLENVLFGNSTDTRTSSTNIEKPRHILFEDVELERQRIEEELNKTKYRLLNTNELLNESELNNVRLSEQVSLLKDEIRRMERNMDRAESISNLEYLKNIILKFFILKSSLERLQLIPVLVTMLKLSPDEQSKLVRVAQQTSPIEELSPNIESNTQQVNNSTNSSSWSSYLNMW